MCPFTSNLNCGLLKEQKPIMYIPFFDTLSKRSFSMTGLTDNKTESNWVDIVTIWYVLEDNAYQHLVICLGRPLCQCGPEPTFTDSEVITVALIIETFFGGHEDLGIAFVKQYHLDLFPKLLDKSQFNRHRRWLTNIIEMIRRLHTQALLAPDVRVRLIDSAPVPACTYTRQNDNETVMGPEYRSVVIGKRAKLFGHRFYAIATVDQVIDHWMIVPTALKEGKMTPAFIEDQYNLLVLADYGFQSPLDIHWLQENRNITLATTKRRDAL
jgi:hypothetical protein